MDSLTSLCIYSLMITLADSSNFTVFYEHPDIAGKACNTKAFDTFFGRSELVCASKCVDTGNCDSFFYATSGQVCEGCTETYTTAGQLTGDISGSLYYAKTLPPPPPPPRSYIYLGCFAANCNGQPCNYDRVTYDGQITIESCYDGCQGYTVFAAKNVNCFCDPDYPTTSTGCTYTCRGNTSQSCGGSTAMDLFKYDDL